MPETANPLRFKGKASLGAMSWNLPKDDWQSPWSFEDEWVVPEKDWREKLIPPAEPNDPPKAQVPVAKSPADAGGDRTVVNGMILRFEDNEPEEDPAVLPSEKKLEPLPDEVRFRPPEVQAEKLPLRPAPISKVANVAAPEVPPTKPLDVSWPQTLPELRLPSILSAKAREQELVIPKIPRSYHLEPLPEPPSSVIVEKAEGAGRTVRRANHISWSTLVSLSLGTLGFTLIAWIYLHDTPRDSDEDLRPQVVIDQTPSIQSVTKLRAFLDSIRALENEDLRRRPAWTWDTPSLSAFVRANGTAFDNLRDLLEDYDWHPYHSEWHREDLSRHASWQHAAYLLQAQASYLARRGDEEPAFVAAVDLAELSRRLLEVWSWPGYMQHALDLHTASAQMLAELLKATRLSHAAIARFEDEFTRCQPADEVMRQACAAYYIHEKKLLMGPASGELLDTMPGGRLHQRPGRLFFKVNETLSLFASAFRDLRDETTRPLYTRLSVSMAQVSSNRLSLPHFYHPNWSGEIYFKDRIDRYLDLPQNHGMAKARNGLVRCLFAIRRYLADQKTLPRNFNDLTPKYLTAIPQDPFSGEPYHYEPTRGLLYSVGVNLIPEGGRPTEPPLNDEREPTVELGIAIANPVKK